jgi:hypothetical protein
LAACDHNLSKITKIGCKYTGVSKFFLLTSPVNYTEIEPLPGLGCAALEWSGDAFR